MGKWKTQINVKVVDSEGRLQPNHNIVLTVTKVGDNLMSIDTGFPSGYLKQYTATSSTDAIATFTIPAYSEKVPRVFYLQDTTYKTANSSGITINTYAFNIADSANETAVVMPNPVTYTVKNNASSGSTGTTTSTTTYRYTIQTRINGNNMSGMTVTYLGGSGITSGSMGTYSFNSRIQYLPVSASGIYNNVRYQGSITATGSTLFISNTVINMTSTVTSYTYDLKVIDGGTRLKGVVSDVSINADGTLVVFGSTNESGICTFHLTKSRSGIVSLTPSLSTYTAGRDGYKTVSGSVVSVKAVNSNTYSSLTTITMYKALSIYGRCYDATTTKPLSGVSFNVYYDSANTSSYVTEAVSDENGLYYATMGNGQKFYKWEFVKDGYVHEDNIMISGLTMFQHDMQWDQIFWQNSLPTDVNKSIIYKEWLIANRSKTFENLPEDRFQVVQSQNIKKMATNATFNDFRATQGVPKNYPFNDIEGFTFYVDTDKINTYGYNGRVFACTRNEDMSTAATYYMSSLNDTIFIPQKDIKYGFALSYSGKQVIRSTTSNAFYRNNVFTTLYSGITCLEYINWSMNGSSALRGVNVMGSFVRDCTTVEYVNISDSISPIHVPANNVNCYASFSGCTSLMSVNIANLIGYATETNLRELFAGCMSLERIDFSGNMISNPYGGASEESMFSMCSSLQQITVNNCDDDTIDFLITTLNDNNMGAIETTSGNDKIIKITNRYYTVSVIFIIKNSDADNDYDASQAPDYTDELNFGVYALLDDWKQIKQSHGNTRLIVNVPVDTTLSFEIPELPDGYYFYDPDYGTEYGSVSVDTRTITVTKDTVYYIRIMY